MRGASTRAVGNASKQLNSVCALNVHLCIHTRARIICIYIYVHKLERAGEFLRLYPGERGRTLQSAASADGKKGTFPKVSQGSLTEQGREARSGPSRSSRERKTFRKTDEGRQGGETAAGCWRTKRKGGKGQSRGNLQIVRGSLQC